MFGANFLIDYKVKVPSKKKYPCKRNKGEHEWNKPTFKYEPDVNYIYKTDTGILQTNELCNDLKLIRAEVKVWIETSCKHCGHKVVSYLSDKIS